MSRVRILEDNRRLHILVRAFCDQALKDGLYWDEIRSDLGYVMGCSPSHTVLANLPISKVGYFVNSVYRAWREVTDARKD